jgi:hypothetical protein
VKEMINFYNNLEGDENDLDESNVDRIFFIKPAHEINLRLHTNSSSENNLKVQKQVISSEQEEYPKTKITQ